MQTKVGLLPLYLKLYDDTMAQHHPAMEQFRDTMADELRRRGLDVLAGEVCRVAPEFESAIAGFETAGVDAIVTLHLAYSPSEESAPALARTPLPVIVLDTTPDADYSPAQNPDRLMYNHGIHGVQDLCNLLIRHGKPFQIEAGHWQAPSDSRYLKDTGNLGVLDRVAQRAQAAALASAMRRARVGRIGTPFKGMGDFAVPSEVMRETIGVETVPAEPAAIAALAKEVSEADVQAELDADRAFFGMGAFSPEAYQRSVRASLAVRRWIERERLTGFTMNFMEVDRASGMPTLPFLEASKAMARGVGYGGEGDVLTAALVGALGSTLGDTTFTEMFCADWAGDTIFLSHMGELNVALTAGKPKLVERSFDFIDADSFVLAYGRFKPGEAVLVNLAPGPKDTFTLIVAPVSMLDVAGEDKSADSVHGWFRPRLPVADFLADYSRAGGTHHCALVYGDVAGSIIAFGDMMGWAVKVMGR